MKEKNIQPIITWIKARLGEKGFVVFLSFLVGVLAAFAAFALKSLIHGIQNIITHFLVVDTVNILYLLLPGIGILLTGLFVRYIVKDNISHGVTRILYAISRQRGVIKAHNMWSSLVGSSVTIGFGGSVGAESPIVLTGAAIGSNLGRFFKLEHKTMMLLIGCGAAGAIAGIFKAPIAGLFFTMEVLLLDLTMTSLIPLMVSCVTAATLTYFISGSTAQFQFMLSEPFGLEKVPYVILLGVLSGFLCIYFTKTNTWYESIFGKLKHYYQKVILAIVTLSVLIFIFPPLFGEGYLTIDYLLAGQWSSVFQGSMFYAYGDNFWIFFVFMMLVLLMKPFATSATNGGGGVGGLFAPSLFLGSILGALMSHTLNHFGLSLYEKNFALMGMAGVMAGMMHAPLMGMFLIAELTGGYQLFLPLMVVASTSYMTVRIFQPHSIYAIRLAQKGELLSHNKDKAVLTLLCLDNLIEKDFNKVDPQHTLGEMIRVISHSKRNIFPVVDKYGYLKGVVLLDDIKSVIFRPELYNKYRVQDLMISVPYCIDTSHTMEEVMEYFDRSKAWNLPILKEGKYVGFISKSKIFNVYRSTLVNFSEE